MPRRGNEPGLSFLIPHLSSLRAASRDCHACDLWRRGTQTVFGEGAADARVVFVGEQPGDKEDVEVCPFAGPAGGLLDMALLEAKFDGRQTCVTNAVKHFKWEPRGKRRTHKRPKAIEISACRLWLDNELELVRPAVIVCLAATAAQALLGSSFRVTPQRGRLLPFEGARQIMAKVHPSSILRARDDESRHREFSE
jgi:uracil-DNA glycosylase